MRKNIGRNVTKNLSGKYSQKFLDHAKKSATDEEMNEDLSYF